MTPIIEYSSEYKPPLSKHMYVPKDDKHIIVLSQDEMKEFGSGLIPNNEKIEFENFADSTLEICKDFLEISDEINRKDLGKLSRRELKELFARSQNAVKKLSPSLFGFMLVQKDLKGILKKELGERDFEDYFDKLARKKKLNENEKEERNLLRIAAKVKKDGYTDEVEEEIREHRRKYQWYPVYDYTLEPWDISDFKDRIEDVKDDAEEELSRKKSPEKIKGEVNEVLEEIDADQELRDWVELVQRYLFLRTYRTNMLRKFYFNILPLIEELGERLKWDKSLVPYLTRAEIEEYLKTGEEPEKGKAESRKERFLIIKKNDEIKIYTKHWKIMETIRDELHKEGIEVLSGEGIYGGKRRGTVKIVESAEDEITEGDILVSTMTTPDMTPLLKKASAVVTDEGGMTCHAAVISKEMGIPCVMGTENATEKLENDDWVEVNSDDGKVLKVEQELPSVYNQVSIVGGHKKTYLKFNQFASDMSKELLAVSVGEEIPSETEKVLKKLQERGVEMNMIVTKKNKENISVLKKHNEIWASEIRYNPQLDGYYFGVIDGEKYFQSIRNPRDPDDRFFMFVQNESIADALQDYFKEVWEESKKIEFEDD